MLTRYSQDSKGKTVQKALIYTKKEHGIKKELLDPEAVAEAACGVVAGGFEEALMLKPGIDRKEHTFLRGYDLLDVSSRAP